MNKINKSNLIILALLYKYINNRQSDLKLSELNAFINAFNKELLNRNNFIVSNDENENQQIYYFDKTLNVIRFQTNLNLPIALTNVKAEWIDTLPKEIIVVSLLPEVLKTISVSREKIGIKICIEPSYILGYGNKNLDLENNSFRNLSKESDKFMFLNSKDFRKEDVIFISVEKPVIDIDDLIEEYEHTLKKDYR